MQKLQGFRHSRGERRRAERIEDEDKKVVQTKMQEDNKITHVRVMTANKKDYPEDTFWMTSEC